MQGQPAPSIDKTGFFQKPVFGLQLERCPPSDTSFSFKFWKELQRSVPSDIGRVSSNHLRSIFCARYGSFTKLQVNFQMSVHDHRHYQAHNSHLHSHPGRGGWSQHERWEGRHRVEHPGHTLISGFINNVDSTSSLSSSSSLSSPQVQSGTWRLSFCPHQARPTWEEVFWARQAATRATKERTQS